MEQQLAQRDKSSYDWIISRNEVHRPISALGLEVGERFMRADTVVVLLP